MVEPQINRNVEDLDPVFARKLGFVLAKLRDEGTPFKLHEGFRTIARQQWLYGSGRPNAKLYGRKGPIVTQKDGVEHLSNHQGDGKPGSGRAADCYPCDAKGKLIWPPPADDDARWERYASLAESEGLTAGYRWTKPHDPPHVELR